MKTIIAIVLFGLLVSSSGLAQKSIEPNNSRVKKTTSTKQMNLLDEQVKVLNSVFEFGGSTENPLGGNTNYLGLIQGTEMDAESKKELREQYKMYDLSLDPKKKDSLKLVIGKNLQKAIEKSQNKIKQ